MRLSICLILVATLGLAGCASLSVHGRADVPVVIEDDHQDYDRRHDRHEEGHPAHLGIPPGHLPPPGACRVWYPERPPGHQPPPGRCATLKHHVPAGAWLLHRPDDDRKHVRVTAYDTRHPGVVIAVRLYDADTGVFVRVIAR
jgi:hypothetical protein